ncbi:hypothetical protein BB559_005818 [Furculomyces boomerangus]|uniref:DM2 domain-containing protein n=1 Tax=Furculomyces boomerangus TaxID=61424 RepID=A0A2T9Y6H3_9FUNG|nr:hypothetical protein BB559_005818 [Furculomyces boomerangus]
MKPTLKKMKMTDRQLPEKMAMYIPESQMFNKLLEFEKKVDYQTMQKRLQVQESMGKPIHRKRVLRLFLSNKAAFQPKDSSSDSYFPGAQHEPSSMDTDVKEGSTETTEKKIGESGDSLPSWTLRVEGRFIDLPDSNYRQKPAPIKFSEQFTAVVIELDRKDFPPQENIIEWRPTSLENPVDGFEVKRLGNQNVNAKITLFLKNASKKFKIVSQDLCNLLNISSPVTQVFLVKSLWQYIKNNDLLEDPSSDYVKPDPHLQKIFGNIPIQFGAIPELLVPFYAPIDPVVINYTIRVDLGESYKLPFAYDLIVETEEPIRFKMGVLPSLQTGQKELLAIEEQQQKIIQAIYNSRIKRDFLRGFSVDPANFVNKLVDVLSQDLMVITGETRAGIELASSKLISYTGEQPTDPDIFDQEWCHEAVFHYLANKNAQELNSKLLNGAVESAALNNPNQGQPHPPGAGVQSNEAQMNTGNLGVSDHTSGGPQMGPIPPSMHIQTPQHGNMMNYTNIPTPGVQQTPVKFVHTQTSAQYTQQKIQTLNQNAVGSSQTPGQGGVPATPTNVHPTIVQYQPSTYNGGNMGQQ